MSMEAKRRWVVTTRNLILFALLIGLVVIWAHERGSITGGRESLFCRRSHPDCRLSRGGLGS
jgi:hypothetical protein